MRIKAPIAILGFCLLMSGPVAAGGLTRATVTFLQVNSAGKPFIDVQMKDGSSKKMTLQVVDPNLADRLQRGDQLRIHYVCLTPTDCVIRDARLRGAATGSVLKRDVFEAGVHSGYAVDSFAADELKRYLNPDDSGDARERFVGGFHADYQMLDWGRKAKTRQLWFTSETVHGVRSADVDCVADASSPLCADLDLMTAPERTLAILRNATSLEAFVGARFEFFTLNNTSDHPAAVFVKLQFGFMAVEDGPDDVADNHTLSLGLQTVDGRFRDSRVEIGYGPNDLFAGRDNERWKVDAVLTWRPGAMARVGLNPYARMKFDGDFGRRSDSVQTFIGLNFDASRLFGGGGG